MSAPLPVPADIAAEIKAYECKRISFTPEEYIEPRGAVMFENYFTDCPGYVGPVVIYLWPADPGAVSVFIKRDGQWVLCNQTSW